MGSGLRCSVCAGSVPLLSPTGSLAPCFPRAVLPSLAGDANWTSLGQGLTFDPTTLARMSGSRKHEGSIQSAPEGGRAVPGGRGGGVQWTLRHPSTCPRQAAPGKALHISALLFPPVSWKYCTKGLVECKKGKLMAGGRDCFDRSTRSAELGSSQGSVATLRVGMSPCTSPALGTANDVHAPSAPPGGVRHRSHFTDEETE